MYTLIYEPTNVSNDIVELLSKVCSVFITKVGDEGFEVKYQFDCCLINESTFSYSNEFTEEEVRRDFYLKHILKIAKLNGYRLFKEV